MASEFLSESDFELLNEDEQERYMAYALGAIEEPPVNAGEPDRIEESDRHREVPTPPESAIPEELLTRQDFSALPEADQQAFLDRQEQSKAAEAAWFETLSDDEQSMYMAETEMQMTEADAYNREVQDTFGMYNMAVGALDALGGETFVNTAEKKDKHGQTRKVQTLTGEGNRALFGTLLGVAAAPAAVWLAPSALTATAGGTALAAGIGGVAAEGASSALASATYDPIDDPYTRMATDMAFATLGEAAIPLVKVLGKGTMTALTKGRARINRKAMEAILPDMKDAQRLAQEHGATLSLGQVSNKWWANLMQNVGEHSMLGKGAVADQKRQVIKALSRGAEDFAEELSSQGGYASKADIGALAQDAVKQKVDIFRSAGAAKYAEVDRLAQGKTVIKGIEFDEAIGATDELGREIFKKGFKYVGEKLPLPVQTMSLKKMAGKFKLESKMGLDNTGGRILNNILERPDGISFTEAHLLRSDLLAASRTATGAPLTTNVIRKNKQLADALTESMRRTMQKADLDVADTTRVLRRGPGGTLVDEAVGAGEAGPSLKEAYDSAAAHWSEGHKTYNNRFIKGLMAKDPNAAEEIYRALVDSNHAARTRDVLAMMGPENAAKIRGEFIMDLMGQATKENVTEGYNFISGHRLKSAFSRNRNATTKVIMGDAQHRQLERFAKALDIAASRSPDRSFIMGTQIIEAGAVGSLAFGGGLGGLTILLPGKVLGKMVTNEKFVNLMLRGASEANPKKMHAFYSKAAQMLIDAGGVIQKNKLPKGGRGQALRHTLLDEGEGEEER
jgi:hypothetical protein